MRFSTRGASEILVAGESGWLGRRAAALRSMTFVVGVAWAMSGCSGSSASPVAPSPSSPPRATGAAPAVTSVLPAAGSTGGGATTQIVGTGFRPGMVAMFDGIRVTGRFDSRDATFSTFHTEAPAHAAGVVDLVVTNTDGQSQRLASGYTYVPQESFDLNGAWSGFSTNGTDTLVEFVIRDNRLVSALCGYTVNIPFTFTNFPTVANGAFSFTGTDGAMISGRIVAAAEILGTVSLPSCTTTTLPWRARRRSN